MIDRLVKRLTRAGAEVDKVEIVGIMQPGESVTDRYNQLHTNSSNETKTLVHVSDVDRGCIGQYLV
jgi:hypothetical protein